MSIRLVSLLLCIEGMACSDARTGTGATVDSAQTDSDGDSGEDGDATCGDGEVDEGEACDDANDDNTDDCLDTCEAASCGDGFLWAGNENCDDGNLENGDACSDVCAVTAGAIEVVTGFLHTCALFWDGQVKCWGRNDYGQLGIGSTDIIGDDETPDSVGFVDLGGTAIAIACGAYHSCALMDDASVVCWGNNSDGELGYGHTSEIGDDESPSSAGRVSVGDDVVSIALGWGHTCVLTDLQTVRCWGSSDSGELGQGDVLTIGDDELPSAVPPIDVGGDVVDLAVGADHACVLMTNGDVRCWGDNSDGELGQGNLVNIGDVDAPSSAAAVSLGDTPIVDIVAGGLHTCVRYDDDSIRCWGYGGHGQLGHGDSIMNPIIGDDEVPSSVSTVNVGAVIDDLYTANQNTCVRVESDVKCWGNGTQGANGYGNKERLGDAELPASYGMVNTGMRVTKFGGGNLGGHICALSGPELRCWGRGGDGQLGYGNTQDIGDDEIPASVGNVPYY